MLICGRACGKVASMNKTTIRVCALAASPRRGGNSETLLDAFLAGATQAGATIEKIHLAELRIQPCDAGEDCYQTGDCHIDDDAVLVQEKLLAADIVVLATPVYFYAVTTHAKLLIDRCQALWARINILGRGRPGPRGKGVLLSVAATAGERSFEGVRLTTRYWMDTFYTDLVAERCLQGIDAKGDIVNRSDILDDVRQLGRDLVRETIRDR